MLSLFEKIKFLAKRQGISITKVEQDLNYSRGTINKLKHQPTSANRVLELANYFQVSTDYLLGKSDDDTPSWAKEEDILLIDKELMKNTVMMYDGVELTQEEKNK